MRVYAHTDWVLPGYSRLTHEAVTFRRDTVTEVTDEVGQYLLGTHPLQFCRLEDGEGAGTHGCPLGGGVPPFSEATPTSPVYAHREVEAPPLDRAMRPSRRRRR